MDWTAGLPRTDDEVIERINSQYKDEQLKFLLTGIFLCRRKMGDDTMDAYLYAMKEHLGENGGEDE